MDFGVNPLKEPIGASVSGKPHRIDVHHHVAPPFYIPELQAAGSQQHRLFEWSPSQSIAEMDRSNVATAIVSISEPGVSFLSRDKARAVARQCNDYAARMADDHPGRFGNFATLPIPDVDASLREIEYALDVLKADGVCLLTSYGSKYLGDPLFMPLMEELNRRKSVVFTHPARPTCCVNVVPDVPVNVVELGTDTARAMAGLVFSGTASQCPDLRIIFSHGGGTGPVLAGRFVQYAESRKDLADRIPNGPLHEMQKFFYDTANAANPWAPAPVVKLAGVSQILYGSDFPFRSSVDTVRGLIDYGFTQAELQAIDRGNALALLPRLQSS